MEHFRPSFLFPFLFRIRGINLHHFFYSSSEEEAAAATRVKYSREPDNITKSCKAKGSDLRVHFKMDWQGQKLAEHLMQLLLVCFAVVAFITGYVLGSFQMMMLIYAAGVVLTSLLTVPNWPFFNRHTLNWLDPSEAEKHPKPQPDISGPKKKTSKK